MVIEPISERQSKHACAIWQDAQSRYELDRLQMGAALKKRWPDDPTHCSREFGVSAHTLWALSGSLTEKAERVFAGKVRELFKCKSESGYQQLFSELKVAALLASRVSPISFEPIVSEDTPEHAKPKCSDYGILLPEALVFVEASTIDVRGCGSSELMLRRIKRKLNEKESQVLRNRIFVLMLDVHGSEAELSLFEKVVRERLWPNPQFQRFSGICAVRETSVCGNFEGLWLPNTNASLPVTSAVENVFRGRRCYHLHGVHSHDPSDREIRAMRLNEVVSRGIVPIDAPKARLEGGPLGDMTIRLRRTEEGESALWFTWELEGELTQGDKRRSMPPDGPVQAVYKRGTDTHYTFEQYRVWLSDWRPTDPSHYLLTLTTR